MAESDWDTVTVLRKKGPTAAQAKSKQAILAAQRRGEDVETSKKCRGRRPEQAAFDHQEHGQAGPGDRGAAPRSGHPGGRQGHPAGPAEQGADAEGLGHENQREAASHCGLREWPGHSQQPGSGQDRESHWPEAPGEGHWEADREGAKGKMNIKPRNQCVPADLVRLVPSTTGASTALSTRPSGTWAGGPPGNPSHRTCCLTNKTLQSVCF